MDLGFADATAVVGGGGRGTGFATARCLAEDAAAVDEVFAEHFGHQARLQRAGLPSELGPVAAFLASRRDSYLTGVKVDVDGGSEFT